MLEHFTDLDNRLAVGSCPSSAEHIEQLLTSQVTAVVNLQTDLDLAARALHWSQLWQSYLARGITAVRVPVMDFDKRDLLRRLDQAVDAVAQQVAAGRKVYVHCTAGLNRSPSILIAFRAKHDGISVTEASEWLMERHYAEPYTRVLKKWAKRAGVPF